jgi:phosphoglucosamine mutase
VQVNIAVSEPSRLADADEVWQVVAKMESELGEDGRVLLRPSGTEQVVRVMVEARSEDQARDVADRLRVAVENAFGPSAP